MAAKPAEETRWCLWRQDDNGNAFVMRRDLRRDEACALVKDYQARGHRQLYWAVRRRATSSMPRRSARPAPPGAAPPPAGAATRRRLRRAGGRRG
ncbi:hypothetical protein FA175_24460 [Pseudomonas aeruginosa]|nr:hypothetical protein [Pseudomonas aeruginosa]MCO3483706.1 hypothetical protein [Pseudomonas aeruginosa]RUG53142.1 hypothetical protein IPC750_21215 [Pseudomonas aeruginosa]HBP6144531.1 hypothetical protein [Pseudomonas aeruginosa]HBP6201871.1 hypothetical protein [Pseudomonas aeruginosa]